MKKLFLYIFLGLMICYGAYADPVEYIDDWYLLDNTEANTLEIKDSNGLIKLTVQDKNLILTAKKQTSSIYQFNEDKFDIYLITKENNLNVIYIFNHTTKTLLAANINDSDIVFNEMPWEFGSLMAIFTNCNKVKEWRGEEIKLNYFLTKFNYKQRPKKYKCGYLMFGGRCTLVYDPKTSEYGIGDKMIISNDFNYVGDIDEIGYLYKDKQNSKCELYNKISI